VGLRLEEVIDHAAGRELRLRQARCLLTGQPLARARFPQAPLAAAIERLHAADPFDLVVFGQFNVLPAGSFAAPTLVLPLDSYPLYYGRLAARAASPWEHLRNRYLAWAFGRFERRWYPRQGCVAPVSEVDAEAIRATAPDAPVKVLPVCLPPDPPRRASGASAQPRVLVVGAYWMPHVRRDAARFLAAWRALPSRPPCELVIWGRGAGALGREAAAAGARITEWVEDYGAMLVSGEIYVYPQRSAAGIQTKLQQAVAAGLAAVAHPEMLAPLGLAGGVHALAAESAAEMAAQTARLAGMPELRQSLAKAGGERVRERFSRREAERRLDQILEQLLLSKGGRHEAVLHC
jgi:glycosyltransferase involved in cell wall biosynthesis